MAKLAETAIVMWWKKYANSQPEIQDSIMNASGGDSKIALNLIRKLSVTKCFISSEINLLRSYPVTSSRDHHILATFLYEAELYQEAYFHIKQCLQSYGDIGSILSIQDTKEYLSALSKLEETQREALWLTEKLGLQINLISSPSTGQKISIDRRSIQGLTPEDFRLLYSSKSKPIIFTNVNMQAAGGDTSADIFWSLDYLSAKLTNDETVIDVKRCNVNSTSWARLETISDIYRLKRCRIIDFINRVKEKRASPGSYLFDISLPIYLPTLAPELSVPKIFEHNNYLTKVPNLYSESWPSLFVAPKGARCHLHLDAFGSHFWMALFQGRKRWIFYSKDDIALLKPRIPPGGGSSLDPVFDIECPLDNEEQHCQILPPIYEEVILEAGEIIFVPAGFPHCVENLQDTVAVSGNFVDDSNIQLARQHWRRSAILDDEIKNLLQEFVRYGFIE